MEQHTAAPSSFMEPTSINQHSQLPNASPTQGEEQHEAVAVCILRAGGGVVVNMQLFPFRETFVYVSTIGGSVYTVVVVVCGRVFRVGTLSTPTHEYCIS